jgi:carboxypeptidase PM20D1
MQDTRTQEYAQRLARLIRMETISRDNDPDIDKFLRFHEVLREEFPHIFAACECETFGGSILLRWKGRGGGEPILLMNHQDVVEAPGAWKYPPFAGEIAEGKLWGRGTLDDKGGLWGMLQAADELAAGGHVPARDIYFLATCNEERAATDADRISQELQARGLHFFMVLDEGGMILDGPVAGAGGTYAMVGLGEKGCADLKFIARSAGGHASTPGKDTPLVRLGKFMAAVEKADLFPAELSPAVEAMFACLSESMSGPMKFVLGHARMLKPLLLRIMPRVSGTANAMLRTTLAFTMAQGSAGTNVLPQEAWVVGNMRYSHHQGGRASIEAVSKLAEKYGIETEIMDPGFDSSLSDYNSEAFKLVERGVSAVFPGIKTAPYVMTGATDSRYMSRVCDNCLRFSPFRISQEQMDSIHALNENVDLTSLAPAVDFYRYIMTEVS